MLKGNLPFEISRISELELEVISMSDHLTEHRQANTLVKSLGLVGFDEISVELIRTRLDLKTDVVRHSDEVLDNEKIYVVRADIQEARMLVPRLVYSNLARIMCRQTLVGQIEGEPWPRR